MGNKEPKHGKEPKQEFFVLKMGEQRLICTPENTVGFLYENTEYDHIFYITEEDDEAYKGFHIFRSVLGEHFDKLVKKMIEKGYVVTNEEEISEGDLIAYKKAHNIIDEPKLHELTPREEKHYRFLEYLIEHDLLTDEDFHGTGELFI